MAKTNTHALRLHTAIANVVAAAEAERFIEMHPLSASADVAKKAHWACEICESLGKDFGADTAAAIRRESRCGDGRTMAQEIVACISKGGCLSQGCILFSQKNKYAFLEYVSETEVIFGYHICVCSCIKRRCDQIPALWCECSAGYVRTMFSHIFRESVAVTLLSTAMSGSTRCTFRVQW